jgi:putative tricarboxylic transport membrane protein
MRQDLLNKDFLTGSLFVVFGALWLWLGMDYPMGSASRLGPGAFPLMLSVGLVGIGAALMVKASRASGRLHLRDTREVVFILLAVALFSFVEQLGLICASLLVVLIASFAQRDWSLRGRFSYSLRLTVFVALVFHGLIGLTTPLWPTL